MNDDVRVTELHHTLLCYSFNRRAFLIIYLVDYRGNVFEISSD
jgi:hypothetical protein